MSCVCAIFSYINKSKYFSFNKYKFAQYNMVMKYSIRNLLAINYSTIKTILSKTKLKNEKI